ncbi:hypothetical protein COMA1_40413 [Candidatus Nitrospira nitrosa]|uniref:Uncharacterized protein n=1 Tax=Candidatus Nitrospira nitrosa TaxID=1742972 RepID=A0A0S4LNJ7_9BACT|nr:hypothetical protein COMA1_40413 [Candidatus Nitrospira nitrosa]
MAPFIALHYFSPYLSLHNRGILRSKAECLSTQGMPIMNMLRFSAPPLGTKAQYQLQRRGFNGQYG